MTSCNAVFLKNGQKQPSPGGTSASATRALGQWIIVEGAAISLHEINVPVILLPREENGLLSRTIVLLYT
ncbi:hypothetical protein PGB90_005907 [Kerria lacca]